MLPNTAATMRQSSVIPTTAGTTMMKVDVTGTLLEDVASTLVETILIVDVVKCVWVSRRYVLISGTLLTGVVTSELVTSAISLYSHQVIVKMV